MSLLLLLFNHNHYPHHLSSFATSPIMVFLEILDVYPTLDLDNVRVRFYLTVQLTTHRKEGKEKRHVR